jgi:hypothetical protein
VIGSRRTRPTADSCPSWAPPAAGPDSRPGQRCSGSCAQDGSTAPRASTAQTCSRSTPRSTSSRRRILASTAYNVVVYALTIGAVLILHAVDARPEIAFLLWFLLPLNRPASRWLADRRDT